MSSETITKLVILVAIGWFLERYAIAFIRKTVGKKDLTRYEHFMLVSAVWSVTRVALSLSCSWVLLDIINGDVGMTWLLIMCFLGERAASQLSDLNRRTADKQASKVTP